ncbi:adenylyl-sulfate kinase [Noviherbaspirillum cavernae]|uniref:Adenylyl-sulfate kinase n=1 Tax=Noviherbaspirillum cavernae TaxID=2320862 RepID=A0A418X4N9_9BURK|nr:adenylyl-sulfate kinase [Noviherbaspirillum cavernae]RJG07400.1 adenylyl-sulfate kinase [Noviherbaspirillum cavernae]
MDEEGNETSAGRALPAKTIWLTGLSGAGKSTLALSLHQRLTRAGHAACIIDGDTVRGGLNADLGFTAADRAENVRRVAEICKMINHSGVIAIAALISPTRACRSAAKGVIGAHAFVEVHVSAALAVCEARDVKGLYRRARAGAIQHFTGVSDGYEPPDAARLVLDTERMSIEACTDAMMGTLV